MKNKRIQRRKILAIFYFAFIAAFISFYACDTKSNEPTIAEIETGFKQIPDSMQTSIYWYWISDNISKEGVVKDLESMKAVGINRAFIGNIGLPAADQPYGKVKFFSDEWWDILHTALKKAAELNIEIGIFNSPGWSQSGGPWVKPEQAMRYLSISETSVKGPQKLEIKLEKPNKDFQDVRLLAYPAPKDITLGTQNAKISSSPQLKNVTNLVDGKDETEVAFNSNSATIDFVCTDPQTVRSIVVSPAHRPIDMNVEVLAEQGGEFKTLKKFNVNRTNASLNVGFNPYGAIVIALPETTSKSFRVQLTNINQGAGITEMKLSSLVLEERYVEKTLAKMHQTPLPYWQDYMWDVQSEASDKEALIDAAKVVDISQYMDAEGNLKWDVPEGDWKIIRSGMTPTGVENAPATPEATGLETDKMSKEHIAAHFDAFLGEIIRRIPAEDRRTWKVAVQDSYETGGQNWTDTFIEDFKSQYGYDPVPFIPVLNGYVVDSRNVSDRFLWDLRRLVADKVAYDYVGGLRDVCHQHGLTTWLENYGHWGFPGEFLQYGGQSDEIGGEFWSEGSLGDIENKAASSCGHIYGKRKISAESFTAAGVVLGRHPELMKQRGDRFFTEGINNTLLHLYIQQPYEDVEPGMNAWFGNEFNRKNTWFYDMDMFIQYLKRCNFMLQQGTYVADAAYFIGEDAPKMTGVCDPALPKGYSFDYMNSEVIMKYLKVKDGYLVLPDGMKYRILVLPNQETMRPELLRKITQLVNDGATILGPAPKYSPSYQNYPKADAEVVKLASELWGKVDGKTLKHAKVGKGMVMSGMDMNEAFALLEVKPDFKTNDEDPVLFIHRTLPDAEIYFVSNQAEKTITINPEFRVANKKPELWNPVTATIRELPAYTRNNDITTVPLKLESLESAFIIFRKNADASSNGDVVKNFPNQEQTIDINTPWTVQFDKARRGPSNPVTMNSLEDWTLSANDSIKYFSGTAIYTNRFDITDLSPEKTYYLDLGSVTSLAKVKINGKAVGGVWTAPWRVNISEFIEEGENIMEVAVTNNWMNRLIGDQRLPEKDRKTWIPVNPYTAESVLQPSGLFGPVKVYGIKY